MCDCTEIRFHVQNVEVGRLPTEPPSLSCDLECTNERYKDLIISAAGAFAAFSRLSSLTNQQEAAEAQELIAMMKGRNTDKEAASLSTRRGKEFKNLVRRSKGWLAFEVNHVSQGSAAVVVFA